MSELKRHADFAVRSTAPKHAPHHAGIDESQPWRTAEMQQAIAKWDAAAESGFDPYNHVGTQVRKSNAA